MAVARSFMLGQFATQSARKLDSVALGLFLGNHEVGIYFLVTRLIQAAQTVSQFSIGEISLAVLSRLQHDPVRLRDGIRRALRLTGFACLLLFGGLAVVAPTFVPTLFGEQMGDAAQPLRVLALFATAGALISTCIHVLISAGGSRASSRLAVLAAVLQLAAVFAMARYGMMSLVYAIGITQLLMLVPSFALINRYAGVSVSKLLVDQSLIVTTFILAWLLSTQALPFTGLAGTLLAPVAFAVVMLAGGAWIFRLDLPLILRRGRRGRA